MKGFSRSLAALAVLLGGVARADYVITDLGTFGGTQSTAAAINSLGQVVGVASFPGDSLSHAFLYSNGVKQDLGSLGGPVRTASQRR
jgi:probable HAF family extracellular repeat protein